MKNCGNGKYLPGGPECIFRGKKIPAFVRWHESASITSDILVQALQTMDALDLFPRTDGVKPFLLLDGHGSRLQLPFLKYINEPKDHWIVCIGVPYGTALWQVGDSKEQNGSFNMAITKAKDDLLSYKESIGLTNGIVPTDLMLIINIAWKKSFARKFKNQKAISDRGWNPLNRHLLLNMDLRATMTIKESTLEYCIDHNIFLPNKTNDNQEDTTFTSTTTVTDFDSSSSHLPFVTEELNTSTGKAADCMNALISSKMIQETRERIKEDMNKGQFVKEQLLQASRITASIVIKAGLFRLNEDVFAAHQETERQKRQSLIDKIKKDEEKYKADCKLAEEVWKAKNKLEDMTIKELTVVCKPLKLKEDGPMPKKKIELIAKYKEWHGRPAPSFDISDINDMPILTHDEKDRVDDDLNYESVPDAVPV